MKLDEETHTILATKLKLTDEQITKYERGHHGRDSFYTPTIF